MLGMFIYRKMVQCCFVRPFSSVYELTVVSTGQIVSVLPRSTLKSSLYCWLDIGWQFRVYLWSQFVYAYLFTEESTALANIL